LDPHGRYRDGSRHESETDTTRWVGASKTDAGTIQKNWHRKREIKTLALRNSKMPSF
jgi:hypothetical protein